MTGIFELHQKMTAHLFPSFSSEDERFLALALCGEAGELANYIKKRWRDGVDLKEEIRDEIADIRVYLELIARCFDIDGHKMESIFRDALIIEPNFDNERFISLSLCHRVGKLAGIIETRWITNEDVMRGTAQNDIVNIRVYLEMIARIFLIEGKKLDHRVEQKLAKVIQKHGIKMDKDETASEHIGMSSYTRSQDTLR